MTTDFFAPLVDDPYAYGAIAAANAMSDVYAMGGEVVLALNIAGFPEDLPAETVAAILRGGADKVAEAGGIVAGGHTIIDAEPKFGLCVLGLVHPHQVLRKAGARPGDGLFLTKALGTGIITTAAKQDEAAPEHLDAAIESMVRLNRHASHLARETGAHASRLPLLPGALEYAARSIVTGGAARNRAYLEGRVRLAGTSAAMEHLLFDPQTSGGLLFAVADNRATKVESLFAASREPLWWVGEVVNGEGVEVVSAG